MDPLQHKQQALIKEALYKLEKMQAELERLRRVKTEPVAIIGIGCRFPGGVTTPDEFWQLLAEGKEATSDIPAGRWDMDAYYSPDPDAPGKIYSRRGGYLEEVDSFDAHFFEISPREAQSLDPQQRLLLEVSWEALEHANLVPQQLSGSLTGVFVGISTFDYSLAMTDELSATQTDAYFGTGSSHSTAAGRLSYFLRLNGPCYAIDTACSSSLAALHLACQSLRLQECHLALAGGVNLLLAPALSIAFSKAHMLSPDGRCKTFDQAADGYVRGEGCGMLVLKRLSEALADGDKIWGVIRGSAVNQDGPSSGLTVPSGPAQEAVIRQALANAGLTPAQINYIEAHGTGTFLGDPIEANALAEVFGPGRALDNPLYIGSVKTNLGHLEAAAGMAGLIKIILAFQHRQIPSHLHFNGLNPHIHWENLPFVVPTASVAWPEPAKLRAGLSGFGFGGTNAHIVLEEPPLQENAIPAGQPERPLHLLTLSAKTETGLKALARRYAGALAGPSDWADVCFTANTGRARWPYRLGLVAASAAEARAKLLDLAEGRPEAGLITGRALEAPQVAFLFTGQGAQYAGMGRQLYETQPIFRQVLDRCAGLLAPYLEVPLLESLYGDRSDLIHQTAYTQPALFALEIALAELWQAWGIKPAVVLGHSVGEYVAACVAGVFSLEDGLRLIAARGRLMQALPPCGRMVAVFSHEARVAEAIAPYLAQVSIAAVNGPENIVISGEEAAVAEIITTLEAEGIKTRDLTVSHAFHSPLMEPMLADFERVLQSISFHRPRLKLIANLDGQLAGEAMATPAYWLDHVRRPVQFAASVATLARQGCRIFLETGPQPALLSMARQSLPPGSDGADWLPSLRREQDNWQTLLATLSTLAVRGVSPDWPAFEQGYARRRVTLPAYPFERTPYWFNREAQAPQTSGYKVVGQPVHPLLGVRLRLAGSPALHFEQQLSAESPAFLGDHRIFGQAVMPAAAYLEMALAAGQAMFQTEALTLANVHIEQMLRLDQPRQTLQLALQPAGTGATFEIFSLSEENEPAWTRHVCGEIYPVVPGETLRVSADKTLRVSETLRVSLAEKSAAVFYRQLHLQGLTYGPHFQAVAQLWHGPDEVLGHLQLPAGLNQEPFILHPSLLDACFQTLAGIQDQLYLPVGLKRLTVFRRLGSQLWSRARAGQAAGGPETSPSSSKAAGSGKATRQTADLSLGDEAGLVAEIEGFQAEQVNRRVLLNLLQGDIRQWFYRIEWQPAALAASGPGVTGRWLVLAGEAGLGQSLVERLQAGGADPILVSTGPAYEQLSANHYRLDPTWPESFDRLLQEIPLPQEVLYLAGDGAVAETGLIEQQQLICGAALHLAQALSRVASPPRLWLVTRGAQPVEAESLQLAQAPLWGLGRVIALEQPDLQCVRLDLDPAPEADPLPALLEALAAPDREDQLAYRQGQRYVARLVRPGYSAGSLRLPAEPFKLKLAHYGLDHLGLVPTPRREPGPDEVEIKVRAVGLNFRDVLNALGMLQEFTAALGITSAEELPLGGECAGIITAVGREVTGLRVGDEVLAGFALGSLGSFVTAKAATVLPKPAGLSDEAAVTLPIAFLTAHYGLNKLACLRPGDRVLIHAAAGGVGQAAIQLARQAGAEIFATASPGKWGFLKNQGITHLFNSRTLAFVPPIMELTGGRGVDVVFNSLNGEFITKSLEALAPGGRFVELGKIGILSPEEMAALRPDVAYHPFDLLEVAQQDPALIRAMFDELAQALAAGQITPLPYRAFPISAAAEAFRYMAQARHIGKVVITNPEVPAEPSPAAEPALPIRPDGSYLITGGLGGLGLQVAAWLASRGARHLVLTGRSVERSSQVQETLDLAASYGAQLHLMQADIADPAQVQKLLAKIEATLPPLRGIIHAAGVLADGVLTQQSWERFATVMAPKVAGSWYLHVASRNLPLDFFVCFSSVASLWGSPGQGNYAAANAFMDALAHHRQALGLPGLSLNWGPWAEVGMAARMEQPHQARYAAMGIQPLNPAQGLQALDWILPQAELAQVGVIPVDWATFGTRFGSAPLFEGFAQAGRPAQAELKAQLQVAPAEERHVLLLNHLRAELARILGLSSPEQIDPQDRLFNLGLDSLMAVELKNGLEAGLGRALPATMIFNYPTVEAITGYLINTLFGTGPTLAIAQNGAHVDLQAEARLDPAIRPEANQARTALSETAVRCPKAILLTGATGFLGAFLLVDLLRETEATLYCLVRSATLEEAWQRLQRNLERYGLWTEALASRIIPVVGDLARPRLGLSEDQFQTLAEQIDVIYHNGARLDLVLPYDALKAANVLSTQEILRLACQAKIKAVHYISTIALFFSKAAGAQARIQEADLPDYTALHGGYVQSKWVAEQFIRQAQERGIPASIYRSGIITGHSRTGHTNQADVISRMVKGCYQLKQVPDWAVPVNLTPVDYVSQAIVHLSRQPENLGRTFHVTNPAVIPMNEIVHWANRQGYNFQIAPYEQWRAELVRQIGQGQENPLHPLLPMFAPGTMTYHLEPEIDCQNTLKGLAGVDIVCPRIESLFEVYLAYLVEAGSIEPPTG